MEGILVFDQRVFGGQEPGMGTHRKVLNHQVV